jgi:uncharacterized membrane protein
VRTRRELALPLPQDRRLPSWVVQLLGAGVAIGLAFLAPQIDIGFELPASRAVEMLVAVGAGTVTFIGIVFSLLFVVVQFGSTAFTPRLNLFRDSPIVWRAFALFTAVVAYSFTAALVIGRDDRTSGLVPIVAFAGVLASILVYRRLQMGAFRSIQLASTLAQVADRGREVIDNLYPASSDPGDAGDAGGAGLDASGLSVAGAERWQQLRWPHRPSILQVIDVPRIVAAAEHADAVVDFKLGAGERLVEDGAFATVHNGADPELQREILRSLAVGEERTFEQDPLLALRVLTDIALRALSPAINDPTTAVQAIDTMDGLLRVLAGRDLAVGQIAGDDGTVRVRLSLPSWDDYLSLAVEEIAALPGLSPAVRRRLVRLLDDLSELLPAGAQAGIETHRRHVVAAG